MGGMRWLGTLRAVGRLGLLAGLAVALWSQAVQAVQGAQGAQGGASGSAERGWVVWESNRTGAFRIWIRPLAGGEARQLSRNEPGRDHCCAHLSPDGQRVAFLSVPGGAKKYGGAEMLGQLRLVDVAGRRERTIAPRARHYGEHRAASWWSDDELAYIGGDGDSRHLDLSIGIDRQLNPGPGDPERTEGWLIDATGRWATSSTAHFSPRDPETGTVRLATPLGGCQAWIAPGGQVGVWSAGAGGPIDAVELESRRTWTILAKHDPRLPSDRGYLYFPMLSRDRGLLAFAASNDDHSHFTADYDVFVIPVDPATLLPVGDPHRITRDPAVDRYPDVWRPGAPPPGLAPPAPAAPRTEATGWPAVRDRLVLAWEAADRPNQVAPTAPADLLERTGAVWYDRRGRLALGGGQFALSRQRAGEIAAALQATNTVTVEFLFQAARLDDSTERTLFALGSGERQRGLQVAQRGAKILLRVRTGESGPTGGAALPLATLPDLGTHHLAFTYSPGRLRTWLDGVATGSPARAGDFFPWRARQLTIGGEPGASTSARGHLSHLAIHARELSPAEIALAAERAVAALGSPFDASVSLVDAVLLGRAPLPTVEQITPYREALVVERWQIEQTVAGPKLAGEVRVARWALLDASAAPQTALRIGERARLRLEPYDSQPQLASLFLSDDGTESSAPLWFDTALPPVAD